MKAILSGVLVAALILSICWVGGLEIERGFYQAFWLTVAITYGALAGWFANAIGGRNGR